MNKNAAKSFAVWARTTLIEAVKQRAYEYDIKENEVPERSDSAGGRPLTMTEREQRGELIRRISMKGYAQVMEEVAYTWFNRFIALRFMEVNGYLPSRVRVFTDENGSFKPELLREAMTVEIEGIDRERILEMLDAQDNENLYKYLLIVQCNALNEGLPGMFEKIGGYTELLFPNNLLKPDSVIARLVSEIPEEDWFDEVQIIGWLYQYYNSELKDETFALLKKNVKITKERIPAATQLFTPDWIVRYMVENSLGRLWADGHEDFDRSEWKYYLDEAEQESSVMEQLEELRREYADIKPEQIRFIDPCMGSGHVLVYAFDVLMQIYEAAGWSERDAAASILQHNLYGLDIDKRAYQLAYFALMMKARKHSRRILTSGIQPNLSHFQDLSGLDTSGLPSTLRSFAEQFAYADIYGSLLEVSAPEGLDEAIDQFSGVIGFDRETLEHMMQLHKILSQKYDVVCTNPPYMGGSGMDARLTDFVKRNYPDSKSDLFAVFIEKGLNWVKQNGYTSLITMESWMFLSSFENMRTKICTTKNIINMVHMPYLGKGGTSLGINFGTATVIFKNSYLREYKGVYDYICYYETDDEGVPFEFPTINERYKATNQSNFSKIPGAPVAYWVSENFVRAFEQEKINDLANVKQGMIPGNVDAFVRLWHEVNLKKIGFDHSNSTDICKYRYKWFPYNKGGSFNRWYGNIECVINMENDGYEIKYSGKNNNYRLREPELYFKEAVTWSKISSGAFSSRYMPKGCLFDIAGCCIFSLNNNLNYVLGFTNTKITTMILNIISPTLNYEVDHIKKIPIIIDEENRPQIEVLVQENINMSKTDWNSFETSWDFKRHPLI